MSNVVYHQFGEKDGTDKLFSDKQLKKTMKERRMEKNKFYRFENIAREKISNAPGVIGDLFFRAKHFFLRFFNIHEVNEKEIIIQVQIEGGTTLNVLTGEYCTQNALRHVGYALEYAKERIGEPIGCNFDGEDIVRTPLKPKPTKIKDKLLDYFGLY